MTNEKFSVFVYQYGDADNISQPGRLLLRGKFASHAESIRAACDSWEYFVAEQVGVPTLYAELYALSNGPTIDDVAFHEFLDLRVATNEQEHSLIFWADLDVFVTQFCAVQHWDCTLSPHCS